MAQIDEQVHTFHECLVQAAETAANGEPAGPVINSPAPTDYPMIPASSQGVLGGALVGVRNPRGIIDETLLDWRAQKSKKTSSGPPKKKRAMAVLSSLCSIILCVCGPGNIPGAVAVEPDPMPKSVE